MAEFAGGIAFGMNVGDFLQIESAFQGNRLMHAAAEKYIRLVLKEAH